MSRNIIELGIDGRSHKLNAIEWIESHCFICGASVAPESRKRVSYGVLSLRETFRRRAANWLPVGARQMFENNIERAEPLGREKQSAFGRLIQAELCADCEPVMFGSDQTDRDRELAELADGGWLCEECGFLRNDLRDACACDESESSS